MRHFPGREVSSREFTFCVLETGSAIIRALQTDRDAQELEVAIAIPDQQFLVGQDLLTGLIVNLPLTLHCDQVLLLREAGTVHECHPMPTCPLPVYEVTESSVFKNLTSENKQIITYYWRLKIYESKLNNLRSQYYNIFCCFWLLRMDFSIYASKPEVMDYNSYHFRAMNYQLKS